MVKDSQSSENIKFAMSLQYLQKQVKMEAVFLHAINIKVLFNTLGVKVSYKLILSLLIGMIKYSQSIQINKFVES